MSAPLAVFSLRLETAIIQYKLFPLKMTGGKQFLTLKQFMCRSEVLSLYRDILRTVKKIPDEYYRNEMKKWARDDFKKNKNLTDETAIKMMITRGKMSLRELEQSMHLAKCANVLDT